MWLIYGYKKNVKNLFLRKVPVLGTEDPADMFTKKPDISILNMAMGKMNMHFMSGRSEVTPATMGTSANADTQP